MLFFLVKKKNVQWKVSNLTQSRTYYKSVNHWMWKDAKACNPCRFLSENSFQGSSSLTSPNRYLIDLLDHEQFFLFQYCKFYSYLAFRFAIVSKSSPVQSNTRVWYVVELITVNKSPILFCMPHSWWLFGLVKRNLTIRQRRRSWKHCWKTDFASF